MKLGDPGRALAPHCVILIDDRISDLYTCSFHARAFISQRHTTTHHITADTTLLNKLEGTLLNESVMFGYEDRGTLMYLPATTYELKGEVNWCQEEFRPGHTSMALQQTSPFEW